MRSLLLLCIVFLCLSTFTYGYLSLRDTSSSPYGNDWEHDFTLNLYDYGNSTRLLLPSLDNSSMVGDVIFYCVNATGYPQFDSRIPIEIVLNVQKKYRINDVYLWVGLQGATLPSGSDYTQWVDGGSNAGGVTFVNRGLDLQSTFERLIHLGDLSSILTNSANETCFTVLVFINAARYCGFSSTPDHLGYSPPGCNVNYQALYPSEESYFTLAVNDQGGLIDLSGEDLDNGTTTYYKGYCLTPQRAVDPNYGYSGQMFSSYDPVVLDSTDGTFVENPSALRIINYIINHEDQYQSEFLSGYQCTWEDIQYVIWLILNPSEASNPDFYNILPNSSAECRQWIFSDSSARGQNYTPPCPGGKYLMLIYPVLPGSSGNTCTLNNNTQLVAFPYGGSCLNRCQPKTCTDTLSAQGTLCLSGQCGIGASPLPSMSRLPTIPSASNSPLPCAVYPSPSPSMSTLPQVCLPSASPSPMCAGPMGGSSTNDQGNSRRGKKSAKKNVMTIHVNDRNGHSTFTV